MSMDLDLFFAKMAAQLQLGNVISNVTRVQGGLMHTMYKLHTDKNIYAIKLLNPSIMKRPKAIINFTQADVLETRLEENHIPIVPAIAFNNQKMQQIDGQYFYLYEWYEGKTLKSDSITKLHCVRISKTLSAIHNIEMKAQKYTRTPININWSHYIKLAESQGSPICHELENNKSILCQCEVNGNISLKNVPPVVSICHNDMDCKNVLWHNDDFKIIDLECLSYQNPYLELLELALCWAGFDECNVNIELFTAFIKAYFENNAKPNIDWRAIYYSNYNRLEWLEYNVKRSLLLECSDPQEQALGTEQVAKTIKQIIYYNSIQDNILQAIHNAAG